MKKVQRNITIMIWTISILITIYTFVSGYDMQFIIMLTIAMFGVSLVATVLYIIPINDRIKAIVVLLLVGLGTLATSVAGGGIDGTFLASFLILGMAILYFDPIILLGYSSIYLLVCLAAWRINPYYIVGSNTSPDIACLFILTYAAMTYVTYIGTKSGNKIMMEMAKRETETQTSVAIMEAQAKAVNEDTEVLTEKMTKSVETVKVLTKEAGEVNQNIIQLKNMEDMTIELFSGIGDAIGRSSIQIKENYHLIEMLEENYRIMLSNVTDSEGFSVNASNSLSEILTTIQHARDCVSKSSKETEKISDIIKDIDAIASRTNLLATNARIEAARVGNSSAGFDIVANEIRTLSEQSTQSSDHVKSILSVLSKVLRETELKLDNGIQAIEIGIMNLNHIVKGIESIDEYSCHSQTILSQEKVVFERIKDEFSNMVAEIETSTTASKSNKKDIEVLAESVVSQNKRTILLSEYLDQMKELEQDIVNQFV